MQKSRKTILWAQRIGYFLGGATMVLGVAQLLTATLTAGYISGVINILQGAALIGIAWGVKTVTCRLLDMIDSLMHANVALMETHPDSEGITDRLLRRRPH